LQFSAATHTLAVNCNEMDGDRLEQPANMIIAVGCRASHEHFSNYLFYLPALSLLR